MTISPNSIFVIAGTTSQAWPIPRAAQGCTLELVGLAVVNLSGATSVTVATGNSGVTATDNNTTSIAAGATAVLTMAAGDLWVAAMSNGSDPVCLGVALAF